MGLRPTPRVLKIRFFSRTLFENAHFHSRGQAARLLRFFCNSRDARVRVQETAAIDNCQALLILVSIFFFASGLR